MNDDILIRAARLLRQLASCALTHDAAGRPVCPVCTFQSEANLVRRESVGYPVFVYEIRSHHKPDCELAALADAMEASASCPDTPNEPAQRNEPIDTPEPVAPFSEPSGVQILEGPGGEISVQRMTWIVGPTSWTKRIVPSPLANDDRIVARGPLRAAVPILAYLRYKGTRIEDSTRRYEPPFNGVAMLDGRAPNHTKLEDYEVVVEHALPSGAPGAPGAP